MKKAIFPGSFDPFHNGHLEVLIKALNIFDRVILFVANNPEKKHYRSLHERVELLKKVIAFHELEDRVEVLMQGGGDLTPLVAKELGIKDIVRGIRQEELDANELQLINLYKEFNDKLIFTHIRTEQKVSSSYINKNRENKSEIENLVSEIIVNLV